MKRPRHFLEMPGTWWSSTPAGLAFASGIVQIQVDGRAIDLPWKQEPDLAQKVTVSS